MTRERQTPLGADSSVQVSAASPRGQFPRISLHEQPVPISGAPSSARGNASDGVRSLRDSQQTSVLRGVETAVLYFALPLICLMAIFRVRGLAGNFWFWIEFGAIGGVFLASRESKLSLLRRCWMVSLMLVLTCVASLFQFGPFLGTGLLFVGSGIIVALLLQPRQVYALMSTLVLAVGVSAVDSWLKTNYLQPQAVEINVESWIRIFASAIVGVYGVLYVFIQVQSNLWRSLETEMTLRLRERRLVAEREKVLRGAATAQRLESLGRLAGGIAHDFNNALVVIQCGVEGLDDPMPPEERAEVMDEVRVGVERAAGTARQLLSFAKRNVEEMGWCDPGKVVQRLAKDTARLCPAHVQVRMDMGVVPRIALSETAFEQLVLNLIQNACDALRDKGGTINLHASTDEATEGLFIRVSDDGPGMSEAVAEQAFEPFFTTKGDLGIGLGLSTVWGVVHRHGGQISLDTELERGTRIDLRLPATSEPAAVEVASSKKTNPPAVEAATVLILEDEIPVRTAIRRILKHSGLKVQEASTVHEARAACEKGQFSLLICDGVVPDGGVGAFIHDFRVLQSDAAVILCSGYLEEDLALQGISSGECAFLAKPFSATELTDLVASLLPAGQASGKRRMVGKSA